MALVPSSRYPAQTDADAGYPHGKARNAGSFQDGTGTPLERDWVNDIWGFLQALLEDAGVTPSGNPDEVGASDYLDALKQIRDVSSERLMLGTWSDAGTTNASLSACAWSAAFAVFVAVGDGGRVMTSDFGAQWLERTSGVVANLRGVAASGSEVVAVGAGGAVTRGTSAAAWSSQTSGTANNLFAIAWSGSVFAAVGQSGTVITSPTGVAWTTRTSGVAVQLNGIASSGSLLVAVGATGTIITSPDGVTWTARTSGTTEDLRAVTWTGTQFVAVGFTDTILTSPDGVTWTDHAIGDPLNSYLAIGATDHFVLVGGVIDDLPTLWASRNGEDWQRVHIPDDPAEDFGGIAASGAVAVAVMGNGAGSGRFLRSLARLTI